MAAPVDPALEAERPEYEVSAGDLVPGRDYLVVDVKLQDPAQVATLRAQGSIPRRSRRDQGTIPRRWVGTYIGVGPLSNDHATFGKWHYVEPDQDQFPDPSEVPDYTRNAVLTMLRGQPYTRFYRFANPREQMDLIERIGSRPRSPIRIGDRLVRRDKLNQDVEAEIMSYLPDGLPGRSMKEKAYKLDVEEGRDTTAPSERGGRRRTRRRRTIRMRKHRKTLRERGLK